MPSTGVLPATLEARLARIPPCAAARFVAQFGTIRDPLTIELMGVLATRPASREPAIAWLRDHAEQEHPAARQGLPDAVLAALDEPGG